MIPRIKISHPRFLVFVTANGLSCKSFFVNVFGNAIWHKPNAIKRPSTTTRVNVRVY